VLQFDTDLGTVCLVSLSVVEWVASADVLVAESFGHGVDSYRIEAAHWNASHVRLEPVGDDHEPTELVDVADHLRNDRTRVVIRDFRIALCLGPWGGDDVFPLVVIVLLLAVLYRIFRLS